jgi:hypothetical protein
LKTQKSFHQDASNYRELRHMPQNDKQKTLSALIFRLADLDGKGINRLRVGDITVATYLIQILDMWRKKLNKIAARDRAEKEYWRKTIKDIEKEDGTHINSKALLDTLPINGQAHNQQKGQLNDEDNQSSSDEDNVDSEPGEPCKDIEEQKFLSKFKGFSCMYRTSDGRFTTASPPPDMTGLSRSKR